MGRVYCSELDIGFVSGQRCAKSDAGRSATDIRFRERVYTAFAHMPMTMHHANTVFPKSHKL
jgi:hypothetical protein